MTCAADFSPSLLGMIVGYMTTGFSLIGVSLALFLSADGSQAGTGTTATIREYLRGKRPYIILFFVLMYVILFLVFAGFQLLGKDTSITLDQPAGADPLMVTRSTTVTGRVDCKDAGDPVLIVRRPLSSSKWAVEDAPPVDIDGRFEARVSFDAADEYRTEGIITKQSLSIGDKVSELPRGAVRSNSLRTVRPLTIVSPIPDAKVPMEQEIRGTLAHDAIKDQYIWVFIHSGRLGETPTFAPSLVTHRDDSRGFWRLTAPIGDEEDRGKSFLVTATLASKEAHQSILKQIAEGQPITEMPTGAVTYDSIQVERE